MKIDSDFVEELKAGGYRGGRPNWGLLSQPDIDDQLCADSKCATCGYQGLEYHPFIRDEPRSYLAFVVCPTCGEGFEF